MVLKNSSLEDEIISSGELIQQAITFAKERTALEDSKSSILNGQSWLLNYCLVNWETEFLSYYKLLNALDEELKRNSGKWLAYHENETILESKKTLWERSIYTQLNHQGLKFRKAGNNPHFSLHISVCGDSLLKETTEHSDNYFQLFSDPKSGNSNAGILLDKEMIEAMLFQQGIFSSEQVLYPKGDYARLKRQEIYLGEAIKREPNYSHLQILGIEEEPNPQCFFQKVRTLEERPTTQRPIIPEDL